MNRVRFIRVHQASYAGVRRITFLFVNGQRIRELFTAGSTAEDAGTCRSSTHFQNPLRPWIYAGIEESLTGWCLNYRQPNSSNQRSALTWGTGFETYAGPPVKRYIQTMGWDDARKYFYSALTSNKNAVREDNFAKTFQAVGQVMHLLQDMAVPAHVKNDFWSSVS